MFSDKTMNYDCSKLNH